MNATAQQRILEGLASASMILGGIAETIGVGDMTVPALYGGFLPPDLKNAPRDYFCYAPPNFTLAVGGTGTQTFTVQNDSDFLLTMVTGTVVDSTAVQTEVAFAPLTVQFLDAGSGRQLSNRALPWEGTVGDAQLPFYFPYPKFIDRASDFSTTITNNDPAIIVEVRICFHGFKIFDMMR